MHLCTSNCFWNPCVYQLPRMIVHYWSPHTQKIRKISVILCLLCTGPVLVWVASQCVSMHNSIYMGWARQEWTALSSKAGNRPLNVCCTKYCSHCRRECTCQPYVPTVATGFQQVECMLHEVPACMTLHATNNMHGGHYYMHQCSA